MISNLQPLYHIVQTDDLTYKFITQSGVVYTAYFIDISDSFGADSVYSFSFDAAGKPVKDEKVRLTIIKILDDFFKSKHNSLIVVCDSFDHKEQGRFKLFQRWYNLSSTLEIEKVDIVMSFDNYQLCSSLLIPINHPNNHEIKEIYSAFIMNETQK